MEALPPPSLELSSPSVLSSPGNTRTFLGLLLSDLNSVYVVLIIGWLTHFSFGLPIILPLLQGTLIYWARYSSLYIYSDCNLQSGEETEAGRLFPVPESAESNGHVSWAPCSRSMGRFRHSSAGYLHLEGCSEPFARFMNNNPSPSPFPMSLFHASKNWFCCRIFYINFSSNWQINTCYWRKCVQIRGSYIQY